MLIFSFMSYI